MRRTFMSLHAGNSQRTCGQYAANMQAMCSQYKGSMQAATSSGQHAGPANNWRRTLRELSQGLLRSVHANGRPLARAGPAVRVGGTRRKPAASVPARRPTQSAEGGPRLDWARRSCWAVRLAARLSCRLGSRMCRLAACASERNTTGRLRAGSKHEPRVAVALAACQSARRRSSNSGRLRARLPLASPVPLGPKEPKEQP